jgi:hypothetical protein
MTFPFLGDVRPCDRHRCEIGIHNGTGVRTWAEGGRSLKPQ